MARDGGESIQYPFIYYAAPFNLILHHPVAHRAKAFFREI